VRIFVVGANGQVARSLREAAETRPDIVLRCVPRPAMDLLHVETIGPAIEAFAPDIVVNPAAYTSVDLAESEAALAFAINRDGASAVAAATSRIGCPLLHLSTDYVFNGEKPTPYAEDDPAEPQGVYGRSKRDGERAVLAANSRAIVLRTAWLFAPFGVNFVKTILQLANEEDRLRVVDDQVGCPTYGPDLALAILAIARRIAEGGWSERFGGVTHLAGPDAVSWCGFARKIVAASARRGGRSVPVDAITSAEYPAGARRPANSRLSSARAAALFDVAMPPLDDAIERCVERLTPSLAPSQ
jgi:dTDP-4-dehydrorhamnose reductase